MTASVSFAPAKGRRGAAAQDLIGQLDRNRAADHAEGSVADAGKGAKRKALLERLRVIEEKKAALARGSTSDVDVASGSKQAPVEANINGKRNTTVKEKGKRNVARKASSLSKRIQPRSVSGPGVPMEKEDALVIDVEAPPYPETAAKAKPSIGRPAKKANSAPKQRLASRRTSRSRIPSVMISKLPGEPLSDASILRCLGTSRCPTLAFARKLIATLLKEPSARPFSAPVCELWPSEAIPRYGEIVSKPMDLGTIKGRLDGIHYLRRPSSIGLSKAGSLKASERVATSPLSSASFPSGSLGSLPSLLGALGDGSPSGRSTETCAAKGGVLSSPECSFAEPKELAASPVPGDGGAPPTRESGFIFDLVAFCDDVRLCFKNCMLYCPVVEPLHACARALLGQFDDDIVSCPLPSPIVLESRVAKKEKAAGSSGALAEGANGAGVSSAVTDATSSALSCGAPFETDPSGPPKKKRCIRRKQSPPGTSTAKGSATVDSRKCAASSSLKGARPSEPTQDAKPRNVRQLRHRQEYLKRCRVRILALENGVDDVPLTRDEKARLSVRLGAVPLDKLSPLVRLVSRATGRENVSENDEIEIDLDKLAPAALREIERFVEGCVPRHVGGHPIPREKDGLAGEFGTLDAVEAEMQRVLAELKQAKARAATSSTGGGLWDASSSDSSDSASSSSGEESLSGSDSESSDDDDE